MKNSLFNIFFEQGNVILGYNTLYNTAISIKKEVYALTAKMLQYDLMHIVNQSSRIYKVMANEKFIVNDDVDELSIVASYLEQENNKESLYEIIINPTINCNFHCWYCYETHIAGAKMSLETRENVIRYIKSTIDTHRQLKVLRIHWFGGEPLMYFKDIVKPILAEANAYATMYGIKLISGFTTNGYFLNENILDFCVHHSVKHFQITLDGNKERHNLIRFTTPGSNTYDKIISNIILCVKKGFSVTVRINVSAETRMKVTELLKDFFDLTLAERKLLHFSIKKVWQENDSVINDMDAIVNDIRDNGFECVTFYSNPNTIRNTCYADKKNSVTINYNGDVFKCTARDYTEDNCEGKLQDDGSIRWKDTYAKRKKISVFNYASCLSCPIMPICNAGCSQKKIEHPISFCLYNNMEEKIDFAKRVLLERMYQASHKAKI